MHGVHGTNRIRIWLLTNNDCRQESKKGTRDIPESLPVTKIINFLFYIQI